MLQLTILNSSQLSFQMKEICQAVPSPSCPLAPFVFLNLSFLSGCFSTVKIYVQVSLHGPQIRLIKHKHVKVLRLVCNNRQQTENDYVVNVLSWEVTNCYFMWRNHSFLWAIKQLTDRSSQSSQPNSPLYCIWFCFKNICFRQNSEEIEPKEPKPCNLTTKDMITNNRYKLS